MKSKIKYWEVLCEKHMQTIYKTKINTKHISEKNLIEFIRTLISKYALTDEEILEQYFTIPFKKKKNYINVLRTQSALNEPLSINFLAQVADISVTVRLID